MNQAKLPKPTRSKGSILYLSSCQTNLLLPTKRTCCYRPLSESTSPKGTAVTRKESNKITIVYLSGSMLHSQRYHRQTSRSQPKDVDQNQAKPVAPIAKPQHEAGRMLTQHSSTGRMLTQHSSTGRMLTQHSSTGLMPI
jgi:hypothetical protein